MTYSDFSLYKNVRGYKVSRAESIEGFFALKNSIEKLSLGAYIADVAGFFTDEMTESDDLLRLTLNTLYALSRREMDLEKLRSGFLLKLLCLSGFMPRLLGCRACGEYEREMYFIPAEGSFVCQKCEEGVSARKIPFSLGMLFAFRFLCLSDMKKMFGFEIAKPEQEALNLAVDMFFDECCGHSFETLSFYKSVLFGNLI